MGGYCRPPFLSPATFGDAFVAFTLCGLIVGWKGPWMMPPPPNGSRGRGFFINGQTLFFPGRTRLASH